MIENNAESIPFSVVIPEIADDCLIELENAYKQSIKEAPLTEEEQQRLKGQ